MNARRNRTFNKGLPTKANLRVQRRNRKRVQGRSKKVVRIITALISRVIRRSMTVNHIILVPIVVILRLLQRNRNISPATRFFITCPVKRRVLTRRIRAMLLIPIALPGLRHPICVLCGVVYFGKKCIMSTITQAFLRLATRAFRNTFVLTNPRVLISYGVIRGTIRMSVMKISHHAAVKVIPIRIKGRRSNYFMFRNIPFMIFGGTFRKDSILSNFFGNFFWKVTYAKNSRYRQRYGSCGVRPRNLVKFSISGVRSLGGLAVWLCVASFCYRSLFVQSVVLYASARFVFVFLFFAGITVRST